MSFAANGKATDRLPFKQTSIERAAENTMKPMEFSRTDGFMVSALVLYRAGRNAPCDDKDDVCAKAALKAV